MAKHDKVILTNRKSGDVIHASQRYDERGNEGFMVTIDGTGDAGFMFVYYDKWDIEEVKPPYALPTEVGVYMLSGSIDDPFYPERDLIPLLYILDAKGWSMRWSTDGAVEKRSAEEILAGIGKDTLVKLVPKIEED